MDARSIESENQDDDFHEPVLNIILNEGMST